MVVEWDWEDIVVQSGGWWLVVIGVAVLLVGLLLGYFWGQRNERRKWEGGQADVPGQRTGWTP